MELLGLPKQTEFGRVIPKNAFDSYTNTRQKKLFSDLVKRMTWTHKISKDTSNLEGDSFPEIQVFHIELKEKTTIPKVISVIQKAIPYPIVLFISFEKFAYISTSQKHQHPTNEDISVIDWTFECDWFSVEKCPYSLSLKNSLDEAHKQFCIDLIGETNLKSKSIDQIIARQELITSLNRDIKVLETKVSKEKQFNKKVKFNLDLAAKRQELQDLLSIGT